MFPPAHRRLAGQPRARFRQLAERQAEAWIVAQSIEIIGILIAARNREHKGTQNVIQAMDHPRWIARIGNKSHQAQAKPHRWPGLGKQYNNTIPSKPTKDQK